MKNLGRIAKIGTASFCLALACATVGAAEDAVKPIAPTSRIDLFNGKDFTGWTFFMRTNADPTKTWSLADGVIKCTGQPNGYIRTEKNYCDYKLTVEWRFVKVAPRADNTGVLLHIQLPDKVWPKCIEAQGQHDKQGEFWLQGGATCKGHETPDTRHILRNDPSNEKPVGEWNTYETVCAGDNIKVYVNGKQMNEADGCSASSGMIGIQSEGGEIEVRKVYLEPVKPS